MTVFEMLEREWLGLRHDRPAARRLADVCACAGGARTLGEVEAFVRGAGPEAADAVLLALARRAVAGDDRADLAARVLLQLLLPGTRNLARRPRLPHPVGPPPPGRAHAGRRTRPVGSTS